MFTSLTCQSASLQSAFIAHHDLIEPVRLVASLRPGLTRAFKTVFKTFDYVPYLSPHYQGLTAHPLSSCQSYILDFSHWICRAPCNRISRTNVQFLCKIAQEPLLLCPPYLTSTRAKILPLEVFPESVDTRGILQELEIYTELLTRYWHSFFSNIWLMLEWKPS